MKNQEKQWKTKKNDEKPRKTMKNQEKLYKTMKNCPKPSCKPAGRRREVKARLEEPGGGWRMEVLGNPYFHLNLSNSWRLVSRGLAGFPMYQLLAELEWTRWTRWKWKFCYLYCICLLAFSWMSVLDTALRAKVLVRWFNKLTFSSLLLQSKN